MPKVLITTLTQGQFDLGYKTLFIGSATTGSSVTTGELVTNLRSASSLSDEIGDDNFLYNMARKYWLADDRLETQLDYIFLAEEGGATATTITSAFSGAASEDGSLTLVVGERDWTVTIPILNLDAATDIVDDFVTALNALSNFPFTASNATSTLTLTSNVKGGIGQVPIKITGIVAGLTVGALTVSAGTTPPLATGIKAILDGVIGAKYDMIVVEDEVVLTPIISMLDTYIVLDNENKSGALIIPAVDTLANLLTLQTSYNKRNIPICGLKAITDTDTEKNSNHIFATRCLHDAYWAGVYAVCLTDNADCSEFLGGAGIVSGTPSNRSIPFADIVTTQYNVTDGQGWTQTELNSLEAGGITAFYNNKAGNLVINGVVSTYLTDTDGNPDSTYHFFNDWLGSDFANGYMFAAAKAQTHQRLDSETANGKLTALFSGWYDTLSFVSEDDSGNRYRILDTGGKQDFMDSIRNTMTIDYSLGRVTVARAIETLLSQFRELRLFNIFKHI